MNTRISIARVLSIVAILIGVCAFAGQPVAADGDCSDYVTQRGNTFIVSPTGVDDTENLKCAFEKAVEAGPGSTVQLKRGTYWTGLIEVEGFSGSFVGAGRGRTVIMTVPDMACPSTFPVLINFLEGNVHVADMSFEVTDPYPCQEWFNPVDGGTVPHYDLAVIVRVGGTPAADWSNPSTTYASSSFENVDFHGPIDPGDPSYFGVISGLFYGGPSDTSMGGLGRTKPMEGDHTVANCSFKNTWQAIVTLGLSDSSLTIGGNGRQGNRFDNVYFGLRSFDHDNSSIEFSYNEVTDVAPYGVGVLAQQMGRPFFYGYPWPSPSSYLISHNTFRVVGPVDAVAIVDFGPPLVKEKKVNAVVSHNQFHLYAEEGIWGGIVGVFAQDVLVANNRFSGAAAAGVYFGLYGFQGIPVPVSGWTIIGNNVQQLKASEAPIWLGPLSSHCTVVGGNSKTNVLDQGTDNIITGVNNMQGNPPGPEIQEAMKRKVEILSQFR